MGSKLEGCARAIDKAINGCLIDAEPDYDTKCRKAARAVIKHVWKLTPDESLRAMLQSVLDEAGEK